jgi:hypothetical protein
MMGAQGGSWIQSVLPLRNPFAVLIYRTSSSVFMSTTVVREYPGGCRLSVI